MALVLADRVKETTTTVGTGTVTLAGAVTGFQSFAAVGNANTTYYVIAGQGTSEWEVGIGTYTSSGTTLARNVVLSSSNSGNLVSFSAGTKDVWVDYPAGRAATLEQNNNVPTYFGSTSTWFESDTGDLKVYYNDGNTSQWVSAASGLSGITSSSFDGGAAAATSYYAISVINGGAST